MLALNISLFTTTVVFLLACCQRLSARPSEEERVALWRQKNTWPPNWQPTSPKKLEQNRLREEEIMTQLIGADERWENWLQFTLSLLVPAFTKRGFEVVDTPEHVHQMLLDATQFEMEDFDGLPEEGKIDVIYTTGNKNPKFIPLGHVASKIINELKPMHEQWAGGLKLLPSSIYGVRFYQNGSSLVMHHDRVSHLFFALY